MSDQTSKHKQALGAVSVFNVRSPHHLQSVPSWSAATATPRRTTHGGCAWSLPSRDASLRQPQDGALTHHGQSVSSAMLNVLLSRNAAPAVDAHDDKLSGATRSLSSRILGLNGMKPKAKPAFNTETERSFAEHSPLSA